MSEAEDFIVERSPDGRYSRVCLLARSIRLYTRSDSCALLVAQFNQQLGHGAFKAVFKGYDEEEGIEVAWCQVNMDRVGEAVKTQIHTEVDLLRSLTHKV